MWLAAAFIAGLLIGHLATFLWISQPWPRRPW
jgi:uncharacterized protein involved in exopolysaccharide biosynthesis